MQRTIVHVSYWVTVQSPLKLAHEWSLLHAPYLVLPQSSKHLGLPQSQRAICR